MTKNNLYQPDDHSSSNIEQNVIIVIITVLMLVFVLSCEKNDDWYNYDSKFCPDGVNYYIDTTPTDTTDTGGTGNGDPDDGG